MRRLLFVCFAAAWLPVTASAQAVRSFTLPGATATCGLAIASDGTVVGDDPAQLGFDDFVLSGGKFSFPVADVPGDFSFLGINRDHVIVGVYLDGATQGSFVLANGATTLVTLPGASLVLATAINDAGTIVGSYQSGNGGPTLGFIDRGGRITTLDDGGGDIQPGGIDPSGTIVVGTSLAGATITGFIWRRGTFTTLAAPGAQATFARGVDRRGRVSGTFFTNVSQPTAHGFLYSAGSYTIFDVPGATSTELGSMNAAGEVTGCSTDGTGIHGFRAQL
jgi:uncharacterized membrane protein